MIRSVVLEKRVTGSSLWRNSRLGISCSQEDDRDGVPNRPQPTTRLKPVDIGHQHIEQDQFGVEGLCHAEGLDAQVGMAAVVSRGGSDGLGWVEAAGSPRRIEPGECPEHKSCANAN